MSYTEKQARNTNNSNVAGTPIGATSEEIFIYKNEDDEQVLVVQKPLKDCFGLFPKLKKLPE